MRPLLSHPAPVIERLDTPTGRFYKVPTPEGEWVWAPSVTTIISSLGKPQWITDWSLRECSSHLRRHLPLDRPLSPVQRDALLLEATQAAQRKYEAGCEFGTAFHALAETALQQGHLPDLRHQEPRLAACVRSWYQWWTEAGLSCVATERTVYRLGRGVAYAGTLDCLAQDRSGTLSCLDWKTTRFSPFQAVQLVAYSRALAWLENVVPQQSLVVVIDKATATVRPVLIPPEQHEELWRVFLAALTIFEWKASTEKIYPDGRRLEHP